MAAFAAFEATVNSLPTPTDPHSANVRHVQSHLIAALEQLRSDSTIDPMAIERARQRIAQLPDIPLARRATLLIQQHGVSWQDLWPTSHDLEAALRKALRIRNALFHTGHLSMGFASHPEAERIFVLTERLLFAALDGAQGDLHPRAYEQIPWILRELGRDA